MSINKTEQFIHHIFGVLDTKIKLIKSHSMVRLNLHDTRTEKLQQIRDYDKQCQGIYIFDKLIKKKQGGLKLHSFYEIYYSSINRRNASKQKSKARFYLALDKLTNNKNRTFHKKQSSLISNTFRSGLNDSKCIQNPEEELKTDRKSYRTNSKLIKYPFSIQRSMTNSLTKGSQQTQLITTKFAQTDQKIKLLEDNTSKIKLLINNIQSARKSRILSISQGFNFETPRNTNVAKTQILNDVSQHIRFHCCCCRCQKK